MFEAAPAQRGQPTDSRAGYERPAVEEEAREEDVIARTIAMGPGEAYDPNTSVVGAGRGSQRVSLAILQVSRKAGFEALRVPFPVPSSSPAFAKLL